MPMPAANIMEIHDAVENSGSSLIAPSLMEQNLDAAIAITKTTKTVVNKTNAQPKLSTTKLKALAETSAKLSGRARPHTTTAATSTEAMPVTVQSILACFLSASSSDRKSVVSVHAV